MHRAQDLVQEALIKVALRWPKLRDGNPAGYARTIIARDHISLWRRRREVAIADLARSAPPAATAGIDPEMTLVVHRALARLRDGAPELLDLSGRSS